MELFLCLQALMFYILGVIKEKRKFYYLISIINIITLFVIVLIYSNMKLISTKTITTNTLKIDSAHSLVFDKPKEIIIEKYKPFELSINYKIQYVIKD